MKKKNILLIISLIFIISIIGLGITNWVVSWQYNSKGISHWMNIHIDEEAPKEYLGTLNNHKIYAENMVVSDLYYRTITAKSIPVKEIIEKKKTSIKEWKRTAWEIKTDGDTEIYIYENYEIAVNDEECIIRPITKKEVYFD